MKTTEPKLDDRTEQPYMGIRTQVPMEEMGSGLIPRLHGEVMSYLKKQDVAPKARRAAPRSRTDGMKTRC